ncbi:MAG: PAS domain S-box protein [Syntrophaceae bacterium]|nr:PAS domain S-box protein [Syntrophaceae bacterium]
MSAVTEDILSKEKNTRRIFYLTISRIILVTIILTITVYIDIRKDLFAISDIILSFFYIIVAIIYLFSVIYAFLYKLKVNYKKNIYLQVTVDLIMVTFLILMFGNTQIDFSLFYTLIIVYSTIFLGRKGSIFIASIASILYGLFLNIEVYNLMPSFPIVHYDRNLHTADALTNLIVRITSFYFVAFLASFIVEQEKKTASLLEEKESEFNQLDLLFRSIVESVYTGVMTVNLNNIIKTFNKAAEEITGFSRLKIENRKIDEYFPEFLPFLKEEVIEEQSKTRIEIVTKGKKGNKINLGLSISPLKGKSENQIGYILIFQDITQIKQMEKALEQSRHMALIGEMASGWIHEVRNPLAAITGSVELLKKGLALEGTNKRLMEIILRSKDQIENFTRDFLLLARPVTKSNELVDMKKVVEEVIEQVKFNEEWTDEIKIEKAISDNVQVYANKEHVWQIISNIILNSIQAMEKGGVLSVATQTIKKDDGNEYAEIKISDTGCGIKEDDFNKIFDPFFTNKSKGIGLGLSIVNHIIDGYKGKIKIESTVNRGTTCRVWFPVKKEAM